MSPELPTLTVACIYVAVEPTLWYGVKILHGAGVSAGVLPFGNENITSKSMTINQTKIKWGSMNTPPIPPKQFQPLPPSLFCPCRKWCPRPYSTALVITMTQLGEGWCAIACPLVVPRIGELGKEVSKPIEGTRREWTGLVAPRNFRRIISFQDNLTYSHHVRDNKHPPSGNHTITVLSQSNASRRPRLQSWYLTIKVYPSAHPTCVTHSAP